METNTPINLSFLPKLEAALEKASPAPWTSVSQRAYTRRRIISLKPSDPGYCDVLADDVLPEDVETITLLRNHASTLILAASAYEAQRLRAEEWRKDAERLAGVATEIIEDDLLPPRETRHLECALTAHNNLLEKEKEK